MLGKAEAFPTTAVASGSLANLFVYLVFSSTVSRLTVGLYTNNAAHPGTLLTQATSTALTAGTWNTMAVPVTNITNGTQYWIAVLGSGTGTFYFRDRSNGPCSAENSSQSNLTILPANLDIGAELARLSGFRIQWN